MFDREGEEKDPVNNWESVERIVSGRIMPADRESLLTFVEAPLREAVGIMYDKNILTLGSSCNEFDYYKGSAWISIDDATLSKDNQQAVDAYPYAERTKINGSDIKVIGLHFPIQSTDQPFDIGRRATELAETFVTQPFSWVPKWNISDAREYFKHADFDIKNCSDQVFIKLMLSSNYFFDPRSGLFYMSKEHFEKVLSAPST